jgi:uncharacterized Rmd1/YagE family protein
MKWYEAVRKQDSQKKTKRREKGIKKLTKFCLSDAFSLHEHKQSLSS